MPKFLARSTASVTEWSVENREGISMPSTFSFPRASVASAATRAESIPAESPSTAFENPFLWKKSFIPMAGRTNKSNGIGPFLEGQEHKQSFRVDDHKIFFECG